MSFQLSTEVDKNKVFLVNRSKLEGRLDPIMALYQQRTTQFKFKTETLSHLLKDKPHYGANEAGIERTSLDEPRYIRITDIDEYGLLIPGLGKTAETIETQYFLKNNDLLFARSGATVGKVYIHKTKEIEYPCFFAGYLIRFEINEETINPDYVFVYTQLETYKEWVAAIQRAAGQPNINAKEFKSLKIPIPPKHTQAQIVAKMNAAYAAKKQKEAEAQRLLDSIDDYLLGELGINLPEQEESTIQSQIFTRPLSEVSGGRFDPEFFKPYYTRIKHLIESMPHAKLGHVVSFSNESWDQKGMFGNQFPYIEIGEIDLSFGEIRKITQINIDEAPSRAKMIVRGGDIIISMTRPSRGAIVKIENTDDVFIASTGFAVIREITNPDVNPLYLCYILRQSICLKQMEQRSSGGNYPAITPEELNKILIPIPDATTQTQIVTHISEIRNRAKQLKIQASAELEEAKKEVEAMILGDAA